MAEPVLLVHGTFAYHDRDQASPATLNRWWLRGSAFSNAVDALAGPAVTCAPSGNADFRVLPWWHRFVAWIISWFVAPRTGVGVAPEGVFHWSGDNSESARRAAGHLLLEHLRRFDALGRFHVIAHSHGGSVLREALGLSVPWRGAIRGKGISQSPPLKNLASWTTVGTPFMHFAPDLWASARHHSASGHRPGYLAPMVVDV
jgi:hypothetical protein